MASASPLEEYLAQFSRTSSGYLHEIPATVHRPPEQTNKGPVALEDQFCGWLWIRESKLRRWHHRYVCLNDSVLSYFATFPSEEFLRQAELRFSIDPESRMPVGSGGSLPLGVIRIAHVDDSVHNVGFDVYGACGKKLEVRARSKEDQNSWLRMLKRPARRKSRSWTKAESEHMRYSSATYNADSACAFERQSIPVLSSGWLYVQHRSSGKNVSKVFSGLWHLWRRRFCVIQGETFAYYASEKPYDVPKRRAYVQSVKVEVSCGNRHELVVRMEEGDCLRLKLTTAPELESWRTRLLECVAARRDRAASVETSALLRQQSSVAAN